MNLEARSGRVLDRSGCVKTNRRDKVSRTSLWGGAIFVFLGLRFIFFDLTSEGTLIGGLISLMLFALIILPYFYGEDIRIPPGHLLAKGKNDIARLIAVWFSVIVCIAAVSAP